VGQQVRLSQDRLSIHPFPSTIVRGGGKAHSSGPYYKSFMIVICDCIDSTIVESVL